MSISSDSYPLSGILLQLYRILLQLMVTNDEVVVDE